MKTINLTILIVITALVLAVTSLWNDSFIVDEIPHVGSGYSYVTKGDYRLNPEHPPLAKDVAGLVLSLFPINQYAFSTPYWTSDINGQWNFGRSLIYNQTNNVDQITRAAKTAMLLFFVLSAVLIYKWTNKRYGSKAALIATVLFSFSPTVLAHSRFVTTDMPALFGVLFSAYFFLNFIEKPNREKFLLAAIAFGVAQLTKFSAVLLAPLFILIIIGWNIANSFSLKTSLILLIRSLVMMALGIILVVWPVYALHTMNYPPEKQKIDAVQNLGSYGNRLVADPVIWASDKPIIRPLAQYATGVLMVNQRSIGGNMTFFLGEVRNWAWKHYFPVVYAIKEPLPFWLLTISVILFLAAKMKFLILNFKFSKIRELVKTYFVEFSMLLWIAMYWFLSIRANLNIGVRHLLPTYGFVYILLAGQLSTIIDVAKNKSKKLLVSRHWRGSPSAACLVALVALFGWYVYENVSIYPYYLTYFNQVAGGPAGGPLYVVDSNLDWGQDLKRLSTWVNDNNINKIYLDYFGWADQGYYLKNKFVWMHAGQFKNAREFLAANPDGGYLAVSASFYMGSRGDPVNNYAWLDAYKPVTTIGNSILIWHITP